MKLGERLRQIRREKHKTLFEVRDKTGLSVSYLSDLERGRTSNPSVEILERLAKCYGMTLVDLASGVDEWGELTSASLAPGLAALQRKQEIDEDWARLLNRIELRGNRPQTEEDWRELYLHLKRILGDAGPRKRGKTRTNP